MSFQGAIAKAGLIRQNIAGRRYFPWADFWFDGSLMLAASPEDL
jgi:hypothetical protein